MNNLIRPSQLYEWTIQNLNYFSLDEQKRLLTNLKELDYIPAFILGLSVYERLLFKNTLICNLENREMPFCLMSLTCCVYNLRINQIDVTGLEDAINTSQRVREELMAVIPKLYFQG